MITPAPSSDSPGTSTVAAGTPLYRLHRVSHSPSFFDTSRYGRFNPSGSLTSVFGTLYLAFEPAGAFIETLGRSRYLTLDAVNRREMTTITFARPLIAFVLDATINRFHHDFDLAGEAIATRTDYARTQQLAVLLHADGFDAISYPARHDNSATLRSLAVFGPPGDHSPDDVFAECISEPVASALVDDMVARYGFGLVDDTPLA